MAAKKPNKRGKRKTSIIDVAEFIGRIRSYSFIGRPLSRKRLMKENPS